MKLKKFLKIDKLYLFSLLIPIIIMLVIFYIRDIFPFGEADRSFLHIDMYHQYFPFLTEFYHKLKNGESLLYSWNTGIGSNFIALYAYYLASPINWLCVLVPEPYLMEFQTYFMVLKIGLCGLTFTYYIRKHFQTESWIVLCFSLFYALSGFMAAYNWNVMWLDVIVLAPLVILGLERLVIEGKCKLYCIALGLSILSNYYLSIMLCIFLTLYFIVLLIAKNPTSENNSAPLAFPKLKSSSGRLSLLAARPVRRFSSIFPRHGSAYKINNFYANAVLRFGLFSLLAGGMAAVLLLPELAALRFTEFSDISFPKKVKTYFSIIDMLARHCFNVIVETGLDHWPNIYCGVAIFVLLPLYALQKKIPLREKVPKLFLLAFMLVSYSTNTLNFIWHGLNYPDSLPARQSYLYIFLLLTLCFEALMHIRKYGGSELTAVSAGAVFFVLLCEKLITDDSFTGVCFLATLVFLLFYAGFLHFYKTSASFPKWAALLVVLVTIAESGVNTYLTSAPTVSRTTYLSNYDSYQILTKRTVENEGGDFFRFDKFARRTQNDAMLIGFQGSSYFSSTLNVLVSDFYEKYGMKGSRVNYCFDGATPVTAALLANRYMLYTLDRGYDNVFELADTEGKLYLYKNRFSLPLGYVISQQDIPEEQTPEFTDLAEETTSDLEESTDEADLRQTNLDALFTDAEEVEENLHEDEDDEDKNLNPIERQIKLVHKIGIPENIFTPVEFSSYGSQADVFLEENAHYYAYAKNTKIDTIKMEYEEQSKSFTQIKKKYILDLGYHEAGETVSLRSENGENLNLSLYKLEEDVLQKWIDMLSRQTLTVDGYTETHLDGHINITNAGQLVLSVPYEPGWTLRVDGVKTDISLFEDTFISVYLSEGTHTISLSYFPKGLISGIVVSVVSIALFAAVCLFHKKFAENIK